MHRRPELAPRRRPLRTLLRALARTTLALGLGAACASGSDVPAPSDGGDPGDGAGPVSCATVADCDDDGIFCNGGVMCHQDVCTATAPPRCDDGVACTVDSCDEERAGCLNIPNDALCGAGFNCAAGIGCTPASACEFAADCPDTGLTCVLPVCLDGDCLTEPLDCDDADPCTADACAEPTGCANTSYDNLNDPEHCGETCEACPVPTEPHRLATCTTGACGTVCELGYWDVNGLAEDGCEVGCPVDPTTTIDVPDDSFADQNCDGIDGTVADGTFVAEDGSDANPGTQAFPVKTITRGLVLAESNGKHFVYVSAGTYAETLRPVAGIGVHGGYLRASGWLRDGTRAVVQGPRTGALNANGIDATTPTTIEYLELRAADATLAGRSSHGAVVANSAGLRLRHLAIVAGAGTAGLMGASPGSAGDDGGRGADGAVGFTDDPEQLGCPSAPDPPLTTAGGDSCLGGSSAGGMGGRGCLTDTSAWCAGTAGTRGSSSGAGGGAGGQPYTGLAGGNGDDGGDGDAGARGQAGTGGTLVGLEWRGAGGGDGADGQDGGGGGGAAGGGSTHPLGTCSDWAGSGGGSAARAARAGSAARAAPALTIPAPAARAAPAATAGPAGPAAAGPAASACASTSPPRRRTTTRAPRSSLPGTPARAATAPAIAASTGSPPRSTPSSRRWQLDLTLGLGAASQRSRFANRRVTK